MKYIYPNAGSPWIMLSEIEKTILDKIKSIGKPLKDWDITINRGILTGLNEAFIIDGAKKDELIKSSLRNMEIIKPILRGRDIKKYRYEFADKWLIATMPSMNVNIEHYPDIKKHLESYRPKIDQSGEPGSRKKTSNKWFETQDNIAYLKDFTKPKIVWQRITDKNKFVLIRNEFYILDSMAFISNIADQKEDYLLGVFNSSLVYFWMQKNVHEYGKNGFRLSNQYVETLPIPIPTQSQEKEITRLVQKILDKEGMHIEEEERSIDKMVYEMFQLTSEEIEYVESRGDRVCRIKYIYPNAGAPWIMLSEIDKSILDKIKSIGKPLKDWDITINYGIKTGLNEAFIIDGDKKDELIKSSLRNMEIIKPILRGRDIKKYRYEFADKWLLNIPWHFPLQNNPEIKGASQEAESIFQKTYPVIYQHLESYKEKLENRNKAETGIRYEWYALQRCGATYLKDFTKPKIVWQEICQEASFAYDDKGFYPEASTFFLTSEFENLLYLLAVFNSKLCEYTFKKFFSGGGLGENGFRYKKVFFETLPISIPSLEQEKAITKLVQKILDKEGMHIEEECREIDSIVYKMFQLTSEEIEYVESRGDRVCRIKYIYPNAGSPWIMLSEIEKTILDKIKFIGKPLKDWDITINYGIKTGLNEAFIIDGQKKDELIKSSLRNMEIINPILRGRDIKKYRYEFADKWLLNIPWHFPLQNNPEIKGASQEAESIFQKTYPVIHQHLESYKEKLENRNKAETGIRYEWYALQRCGATYLKDFTKLKIVWQRITDKNKFVLIRNEFYILNSMAFISNIADQKEEYLLGVLNSSLVYFWMQKNVHEYGKNGFGLSNQYVETLPIPIPTQSQEKEITRLVQEILNKEGVDIDSEQKAIDKIVYEMFQLSEEETEYVESI